MCVAKRIPELEDDLASLQFVFICWEGSKGKGNRLCGEGNWRVNMLAMEQAKASGPYVEAEYMCIIAQASSVYDNILKIVNVLTWRDASA